MAVAGWPWGDCCACALRTGRGRAAGMGIALGICICSCSCIASSGAKAATAQRVLGTGSRHVGASAIGIGVAPSGVLQHGPDAVPPAWCGSRAGIPKRAAHVHGVGEEHCVASLILRVATIGVRAQAAMSRRRTTAFADRALTRDARVESRGLVVVAGGGGRCSRFWWCGHVGQIVGQGCVGGKACQYRHQHLRSARMKFSHSIPLSSSTSSAGPSVSTVDQLPWT